MPHSLSLSPIDNLPLETLQRIFELACTDDGYTGNSLSLVSKGIRAAARTTRFHCISLVATPRRLQAFLELYKPECSSARGDKPRIQHLHLAVPCIEVDYDVSCRAKSDDGTTSHPPWPNTVIRLPTITRSNIWTTSFQALARRSMTIMQKLAGRSPSHCVPTTYDEYISALKTLFRLVAPDLVTLVLQCGFTYWGTPKLPVLEHPFPNLREATFSGISDPSTLPVHSAVVPLFPAMTRLYIVPGMGDTGLWFFSKNAPRVRHLAISRAEAFVEQIERAVGVHACQCKSREHPGLGQPHFPSPIKSPCPPSYPNVRHLLLRPAPRLLGAGGENGGWYERDLERLRLLVSRCWENGVEAVEAEAPRFERLSNEIDRARGVWLDSVGEDRGEVGGWRRWTTRAGRGGETPQAPALDASSSSPVTTPLSGI